MRREEKQQIFSFGLGMGMKDGAVGVLVEAPHNFLNFLYWVLFLVTFFTCDIVIDSVFVAEDHISSSFFFL